MVLPIYRSKFCIGFILITRLFSELAKNILSIEDTFVSTLHWRLLRTNYIRLHTTGDCCFHFMLPICDGTHFILLLLTQLEISFKVSYLLMCITL